jgi:hypothetical protein
VLRHAAAHGKPEREADRLFCVIRPKTDILGVVLTIRIGVRRPPRGRRRGQRRLEGPTPRRRTDRRIFPRRPPTALVRRVSGPGWTHFGPVETQGYFPLEPARPPRQDRRGALNHPRNLALP